nr:RNA-directed DNA polymerase, eukaryota [Tanacetum cinerariifolium]
MLSEMFLFWINVILGNDRLMFLLRALVDAQTLDVDTVATHWNRCIPIKVNVFMWRLNLNKHPSRVNLDRKGIDVGLILCPIFHGEVKTVNHTFFNYEMAKDLWALLANWSMGTLLWSRWSFRNRLIFSSPPHKKAIL